MEDVRCTCAPSPPLLLKQAGANLHVKIGEYNLMVEGFDHAVVSCPRCLKITDLLPKNT